jgi:hypothetical protein
MCSFGGIRNLLSWVRGPKRTVTSPFVARGGAMFFRGLAATPFQSAGNDGVARATGGAQPPLFIRRHPGCLLATATCPHHTVGSVRRTNASVCIASSSLGSPRRPLPLGLRSGQRCQKQRPTSRRRIKSPCCPPEWPANAVAATEFYETRAALQVMHDNSRQFLTSDPRRFAALAPDRPRAHAHGEWPGAFRGSARTRRALATAHANGPDCKDCDGVRKSCSRRPGATAGDVPRRRLRAFGVAGHPPELERRCWHDSCLYRA